MIASDIDIVMPVRGDCPWLDKALMSLANQEMMPDKVFVVDDGLVSPELSDRIGRQLFGLRYCRILNKGKGISAALNTGALASKASYIARMDADDLSHSERLKQQHYWMSTVDSKVLGCGTQVRLIDGAGSTLSLSDYPIGRAQIKSGLLSRSCFAHPSLLLRRQAIIDTPYRSAMDGAEDTDLILRLFEKGRLDNLVEPLLKYRIHVGQTNFIGRARQTALQELAFRLAVIRHATGQDPVDHSPELVDEFVTWRLSQAGYVQARQAMTAVRYANALVRGGSIRAVGVCVGRFISASPWQSSVRAWIRRVMHDGPGSLRFDVCPISVLNVPLDRAYQNG